MILNGSESFLDGVSSSKSINTACRCQSVLLEVLISGQLCCGVIVSSHKQTVNMASCASISIHVVSCLVDKMRARFVEKYTGVLLL